MDELAIRTQDLSKRYNEVQAVGGIDLNVPRGSIYGFLGRNGAGKTTTIKMLLGLIRPTSGFARVLGLDIATQQLDILQKTAFVSEKKTLYSAMTASELVRFSRGFYPTWSHAEVRKYATLLDIPMNQRFGKLSNGNQTKVWLLIALCQGAELLILDEPTAALDPFTVDQLLRILSECIAGKECTIFFSSHQLEEVERIADHVGIIADGKLLLQQSLDDVKSDFRMVTVVGNHLPAETSSQVLSVEMEGRFHRYVICKDAERFVAKLSADGASVMSVEHMGLRDIFLQLVRKERPCTSGNAGVIRVPSSSSL